MSYSARSILSIVLAAFFLLTTGVGNAQEVHTAALRTVQPLMEGWRFVQDDELSDETALAATAAAWQTVNLPHTWNAEDAASLESESYERGLGWYRTEFETPAAGARHWLEIGAASLVADVWLNGDHLGQHKSAFTAFRFDVADELDAKGPNALLIKTNNTAPEEEDDLTAIAAGLLAEAAVDTVAISAGRLQTGYVSSTGVRYGSDDFFEGGEGLPVDEGDVDGGVPEIENTDDPMLYKFYRAGEFRYEIPLPDGSYDVTLGFIEPDEDAGEGDRVFNVTANGEPALEGCDVTEAAGGAGTAVTATFTAEVTD